MSTEAITAPPVTPPVTSPPPDSGTPPIAAGAPSGTAPAVNTDPWFKGWLKEDGKIDAKSYERLPEHLKHLAPSLANLGTVEDVFTKMAHLNTLAGKKGLAPLAADAPPAVKAERDALMRSINGVPDKPEGYGITRPDGVPDHLWNGEYVSAAQKIMHAHNAPPAMVKALAELNMAEANKQVAAQESYEAQFFKQQETKIAEQFALDGVPLDKGMDLASRTAIRFGIDPKADPIFKNAGVVLMLQKVGVAIGEPNLVTGTGNGPEAQDNAARAESIMHDKSNPEYKIYWDGNHPQNKAVKQKVEAFLAAAARAKAPTGGVQR